MIRETAVTALDGLVGFRQPIDTAYDVLDAGNLASLSGKNFEDISGFVTIKNIIDTYEEVTLSDAQINTMLDNLRASAARDILYRIFNEKSQILESNILFPYEESFENKYDLTDAFYFIKFTPSNNKRLCTYLDNIILSFDKSVTFNIYLYNSGSLTPLIKSVTTVANQATKVYLGWPLYLGGTYRIGYKIADIGSAKPFKRDFELSNLSTKSINCNIEFRSANFLANNRIDVSNENSLEDGYGMNLEYSTAIDFTDEIIKNKDRFATALQMQMAITVADRIFTSSRSNITQRFGQEFLTKLDYILGNEDRGTGIKGQLRKEIKALTEYFFPVQRIQTSTLR